MTNLSPLFKQREEQPTPVASLRNDAIEPHRLRAAAPLITIRSQTWRQRSITVSCASLALMAVIGAGVVWAATAKIAITASAQGKIAPLGRVQIVAHAEGGAVRELKTRLGQHVKAGDVLIELDAAAARADLKQIDNELLGHQAAIRRLQAEQSGGVPDFTGLPADLARAESDLFAARQARYAAGLSAATGELRGAQAGITASEEGLRPLRERMESRKKLAEQGYASRFSVMEDEARIAELSGRLAAARASAQTAQANIRTLTHTREEEIAKGLVDHGNQAMEIEKARPKIQSRLENLSVTAPVNGVVKSISVTGAGSVLRPGEPLAEIVPDEGERLVEARLPAADIGYVQPGQEVRLTLMPPDMHFRPMPATVHLLAPDSVTDERTGQLSYVVQVKPAADRFTSTDGAAAYPLRDGVPVSVTIVTGTRTVLAVIAGPLFSGLEDALGER